MMVHYKTPLKNNKWVVKIGMLMYDALSYDKNFTWDASKRIPMHRTISKQEVLQSEPHVRAKGLTGASVFYDCNSIFPERLTLAFIKSAVAYGAKVANYSQVQGFIMDGQNHVTGVKVKDLLNNTVHTSFRHNNNQLRRTVGGYRARIGQIEREQCSNASPV